LKTKTSEDARKLISNWSQKFPLSEDDDSLEEDKLRACIKERPAMIDEIRQQFTWWVEWGSYTSSVWDTRKYGPEVAEGALPLISSICDFLGEFSKSITDQKDCEIMSGTLDIVTRLRDLLDSVVRNKKPS
jgi:hypothetical protein